MKTLYLHIGTPKTGTSSLQQFCLRNADALAAQSCAYPVMPFRYRDVGKERTGCFLTKGGRGLTPEEVLENTRRLGEGLGIVADAFERFDTVILSDEGLWSALADRLDAFWPALLSHAGECGYTVKVLVYLRRPDALSLSRYNQAVKAAERGLATMSLEEWMEGIGGGRVDYRGTLERISAQVGRENVVVRVYDRAQLQRDGGSIFSDFVGSVGLVFDESFVVPARDANTDTLVGNFLAIKRAANGLDGHTRYDGAERLFRRAATSCSAEPGGAPRSSLLSEQAARELLAQCAADNDFVAREYLHREGPLFDERVADVPTWRPDDEWMGEDLGRFFARVAELEAQELAAAAGADASAGAAAGGPAGAGAAEPRPDCAGWLLRCADGEEGPARYEYVVGCLGAYFLERQQRREAGEPPKPVDAQAAGLLARGLYACCGAMTALRPEADREALARAGAEELLGSFDAACARARELEAARARLADESRARVAAQAELERTSAQLERARAQLAGEQEALASARRELAQTRTTLEQVRRQTPRGLARRALGALRHPSRIVRKLTGK